ncbi:uncharacterized protein LOC117317977 [Pecten maximus]|uniref:uncharacterized protein LOC117317977 n=1 Tax=Pecten maximus TaxID=6579 RepID=UPI0014582E80|nr:uncharacterized protein LOC117317977 [Pecten maximus]
MCMQCSSAHPFQRSSLTVLGIVQVRTNVTVNMLFILMVFLSVIGYGAPTTTTPAGTSLSPVDQFKAIVNTEVDLLWNSVDHDSSGNLDEADLSNIFKKYDDDGNGQISQREFMSHFSNNSANLNIISEGLFYELDMDDDNSITGSDMQRYYDKIDVDSNGEVNKNEFDVFFRKSLTLLFVLQYESSRSTTPVST